MPHEVSADGKFSWEEVECLGACANAPMAQIGKDYYEDLTAESFAAILDAFARGEVPRPGPQNGRFASEPLGGLTSLDGVPRQLEANASVALAERLGDTVARITGEAPAPRAASGARGGCGSTTARRATPGRRWRRGSRRGWRRRARAGGRPEADQGRRAGAGERCCTRLGVLPLRPDRGLDARRTSPGSSRTSRSSRGRVEREGWVEQARELAEQGETPHAHDKIDAGMTEREEVERWLSGVPRRARCSGRSSGGWRRWSRRCWCSSSCRCSISDDPAAGLIFGGVTFVLVGLLLVLLRARRRRRRTTRLPAAPREAGAAAGAGDAGGGAAGARAGAPRRRPPRGARRCRAAAISERVRDAARAAGEAARAATRRRPGRAGAG